MRTGLQLVISDENAGGIAAPQPVTGQQIQLSLTSKNLAVVKGDSSAHRIHCLLSQPGLLSYS